MKEGELFRIILNSGGSSGWRSGTDIRKTIKYTHLLAFSVFFTVCMQSFTFCLLLTNTHIRSVGVLDQCRYNTALLPLPLNG